MSSAKKVPRQSTLASFFKKTPSKEAPISPVPTSSPVLLTSPIIATPTRSTPLGSSARSNRRQTVRTPELELSGEDEALPQTSRPRKRRKTTRLDDSDDEYGGSFLDDQDLVDGEVPSTSTSATLHSSASSMKPPPKMLLDTSTTAERLAGFLAGKTVKREDESVDTFNTPSKPSLARQSSSRVSTIVPMSKQDQLVEGGYEWLKPGNIKDADGNKQGTPEYNPRTLYIPKSASAKFGNFEKQFWEQKSQNFDSIVFFQKGKFYELYEEDAVLAHSLFDWKMSGGRAGSLRMAGVPDYTFDSWAGQFVAKGYRVARVDQMESILGKDLRDRAAGAPKEKIVRRELTQVLTQGTLVDSGMLLSDMSTFLMSIKEVDCDTDHAAPSFGATFVDAATGVFYFSSFPDDMARSKLDTLLSQIKPRELVLEKGRMSPASVKAMKAVLSPNTILNWIKPETEFWDEDRVALEIREAHYFGDQDQDAWPKEVQEMLADPASAGAFGGLLWYLRNLKLDRDLCSQANFARYDPLQSCATLLLDGQSLVNLDIFANTEDGSAQGTLFALINRCVTPFGKRMMKQWLCHPLQDARQINERLDVVDKLNADLELRDEISNGFAKLPDLERMISRLHCGRCKVVDFVRVLDGFTSILTTLDTLKDKSPEESLLTQTLEQAPNMHEKMQYWKAAFDWETARGYKNEDGKHVPGTIIPEPGAEQKFDESQAIIEKIEAAFPPLLKQYQKELKSSKVRFVNLGQSKEINQIEVAGSIKVPRDWVQLSATKAVTRYWSPAVKDLVKDLQEARELHKSLVEGLEGRFYQKFDEDYKLWSALVQAVAKIDCLYSLAISSHILPEPSCRPDFVDDTRSVLEFVDLRHPCIDQAAGTDFIPNNISLGGDRPNMSLLTGPNMAGKSTLLRSTCIGVILAQLGHYVPAKAARLTPVDQVSVRTGGAKDNIAGSQSTFMVELNETSTILSSATNRSLVILDELGRGTSTFDGMAIACSVLHYLATYKGCLGFFSTHYSNLVDEFVHHPEVIFQNMDFLLGEDGRDVTFLYKLVDGICSHSHGLNVARMAGIEESIIDRAAEMSKWFDDRASLKRAGRETKDRPPTGIVTDFERFLVDDAESTEITDEQVSLIVRHARHSISV